jgi:AcrR family transcriptional regulator
MTRDTKVDQMARSPSRKRDTFHHGNVLEELIDAARRRIKIQGVDSITLRDLASDVGINHRAIYRHCPDKETLLAEAAERCWRDFLNHLIKATTGMVPGPAMLVAAGIAMFQWGRENPQYFHFATGAYPSLARRFPQLEAAIADVVEFFALGFAGSGIAPDLVAQRAGLYLSAMHGVTGQYLHGRLRYAPEHAGEWIGDVCTMLIQGLT